MPYHRGPRGSAHDSTGTSTERHYSAREAKALAQELDDLLKSKAPWHKDVEFTRQSLRRQCLGIIFKPAITSTSTNRRAAMDLMFLSSSHALIQIYRQRITALDKQLADLPPKAKGSKKRDPAKDKEGAVGPVARRRLVHSFRQFLAAEDTFWRETLARIAGLFGLDKLSPALRTLQIPPGDWQPLEPAHLEILHEQAILLAHKTMIYIGDLARYRELYNESNSKKSPAANRERNWARATEAYHQARLVHPEDGNPSNQLAVMAGYRFDHLATTYHYYRALCVKQPFATARQNLGAHLNKALARSPPLAADTDETRAASFLHEFVYLHALLFAGTQVEEIQSRVPGVADQFRVCVSQRLLLSDTIVKVVVTALSSWWYARMYRSTSQSQGESQPDRANIEGLCLAHVLAMYQSLLSVANMETRDLPSPALANNAEGLMASAQSITAVLRRTLPALRILSKWLTSNLDYLARYDTSSNVAEALSSFWASYADVANLFGSVYPFIHEDLPATSCVLEEEIDMTGFLPLKRGMRETVSLDGPCAAQNLHPNEEQILRLVDLQKDAHLLAGSEHSGIVIRDGFFRTKPKPVKLNPASAVFTPASQVVDESLSQSLSDHVNIQTEVNQAPYPESMEDDILEMAMRQATEERLEEEEEEEDDEVVYVKRNSINGVSPGQSPVPKSREVDVSASDLLLQVLQGSPSVPSAMLNPTPGPSIWSSNPSQPVRPFGTSATYSHLPSIWTNDDEAIPAKAMSFKPFDSAENPNFVKAPGGNRQQKFG